MVDLILIIIFNIIGLHKLKIEFKSYINVH